MTYYRCNRCYKTFKRKYNYNRHLQRIKPCKIINNNNNFNDDNNNININNNNNNLNKQSLNLAPKCTDLAPKCTDLAPKSTDLAPIKIINYINNINEHICSYCFYKFTIIKFN